VTTLVQAWLDGTYPNYGIMLRQDDTHSGIALFTAKEYNSDPPFLVVYSTAK